MIWSDYTCPKCKSEASMGIMSLVATCKCGMVYIQAGGDTGWYNSVADYRAGGETIPALVDGGGG
jgi:hypothetical protein